jgi:hypothetical protein
MLTQGRERLSPRAPARQHHGLTKKHWWCCYLGRGKWWPRRRTGKWPCGCVGVCACPSSGALRHQLYQQQDLGGGDSCTTCLSNPPVRGRGRVQWRSMRPKEPGHCRQLQDLAIGWKDRQTQQHHRLLLPLMDGGCNKWGDWAATIISRAPSGSAGQAPNGPGRTGSGRAGGESRHRWWRDGCSHQLAHKHQVVLQPGLKDHPRVSSKGKHPN